MHVGGKKHLDLSRGTVRALTGQRRAGNERLGGEHGWMTNQQAGERAEEQTDEAGNWPVETSSGGEQDKHEVILQHKEMKLNKNGLKQQSGEEWLKTPIHTAQGRWADEGQEWTLIGNQAARKETSTIHPKHTYRERRQHGHKRGEMEAQEKSYSQVWDQNSTY